MDTLNRSSEAELMLLLAGSAERRRRRHERIRELAGAIDEQAFGAEAARQGVQLVVARRLVELGMASESFEHSLQRAVKLNGRRVFPIEARTMFATRALAEAGIPAMPLKGPGLARIVHGTPEMRRSVDIDILVDPGNLDGALRALGRLGYSRSPGAARSKVHIVLSSPDADAPPIELHWRLHWYGDAFSSRLLAEGKPDQDGTLQPSPAAGFAALLLFYAKDGFAGLRLALDIAAYADALKLDAWAEELDELVGFDPDVTSALRVASVVAHRVVGTRPLASALPLSRAEALAARLANWRLTGDVDQVRAEIRLADALLAPPARRRDFVSHRFAPFATRRRNAVYLAKTTARWVPALVSLRRGRFAHPLPAAIY